VVERERQKRGIVEGVFVQVGTEGMGGLEVGSTTIPDEGANFAIVEVGFVPLSQCELSSEVFARLWREEVGEIPGAQHIGYSFEAGSSAGAALAFELSHERQEVLREAAEKLAEGLRQYAGVSVVIGK